MRSEYTTVYDYRHFEEPVSVEQFARAIEIQFGQSGPPA